MHGMHRNLATIAAVMASIVGTATAAQESYGPSRRTYHDIVAPSVRQLPVPEGGDDVTPPPPPPRPENEAIDDPEIRSGACVQLFGIRQCAALEGEKAATLLATGPADVSVDNPEKPSVTGLVRNGWPFVIDFAPEPGTMTVLKVRLYHRRWLLPYFEVAFRQVIDVGGEGGRRVAVLPEIDFSRSQDAPTGQDVRVARYSIRSYRMQNGEPLRSHGRLVPAPVTIFGMGAGPGAVGSMTVRDVAFGPAQVRIPRSNEPVANADFRFSLDSDFDVASATVARCHDLTCSEDARPVGRLSPVFAGRTIQGVWPVKRNAKVGDYAITIRAWLNCRGETNQVRIRLCEDNAAWAFGRAKPVALVQ